MDGNKLNNHADNLEWVTQSENIKRAHVNHLVPKGELHPSAKLKNSDIPVIVSMRDGGAKLKEIAERFGVSVPLIHKITTGKRRFTSAHPPEA